MSIGAIVTVLSSLPWDKVIETAPKVADGASKLWSMVTRRKNINEDSENEEANYKEKMSEMEIVEFNINNIKKNIDDLNLQMQVSANLIKELSQNNLVLIEKNGKE